MWELCSSGTQISLSAKQLQMSMGYAVVVILKVLQQVKLTLWEKNASEELKCWKPAQKHLLLIARVIVIP